MALRYESGERTALRGTIPSQDSKCDCTSLFRKRVSSHSTEQINYFYAGIYVANADVPQKALITQITSSHRLESAKFRNTRYC